MTSIPANKFCSVPKQIITMDSTGDSSSSEMRISSSSNSAWANSSNDGNSSAKSSNNYINSIVLPPAFVADPSAFLTSIASRSNPSPEGMSLLAGPLSKWFRGAEGSYHESNNSQSTVMVHPAAHVAQLYLCAAATQLREEPSQAMGVVAAAMASSSVASAAVAGIAATALSREQEENKIRNAKNRDETLEAVAAAAVLCSDRSAVSSSGILPVLANLVAATSSAVSPTTDPSAAATAGNSKIASSIATSLLNMPSSSSKAFPPLTPAHTAFLQCAAVAEEYEFAETMIRGTWPLPTSALKKKRGSNNDEPHVSVSIIMRYYYLRGIIHYGCGRDHYAMAHRCWWTCLSIPVDVVSTTAIQAWKKLTLVQPLLDINNNREGRQQNRADIIDANNDGDSLGLFVVGNKKIKNRPGTRLPKGLPKGLSKSINALIDNSNISIGAKKQEASQAGAEESREKINLYSVYTHLGPAVQAVDRTSAEGLVCEHESILAADGNIDMARNCLVRVKELQVRTASKMFSVTSIYILARRWKVTPKEASQQLLDAVESGVVSCRVEEDGTVVFSSTKDCASNTDLNLTDLAVWMKLLERMQKMDVNLSIGSKYNSGKQKEDKSMAVAGEIMGTTGPRGVEEFYSDPTM